MRRPRELQEGARYHVTARTPWGTELGSIGRNGGARRTPRGTEFALSKPAPQILARPPGAPVERPAEARRAAARRFRPQA